MSTLKEHDAEQNALTAAEYAHSTVQDLETVISAGIDAVQKVTDLFVLHTGQPAIDELEDWAVQAADYLPDIEEES